MGVLRLLGKFLSLKLLMTFIKCLTSTSPPSFKAYGGTLESPIGFSLFRDISSFFSSNSVMIRNGI